jgi:hypothetical protein
MAMPLLVSSPTTTKQNRSEIHSIFFAQRRKEINL